MNITFTEAAIKQINGKRDGKSDRKMKLVYDTEGCGCVVDGVAVLWLTDDIDDTDLKVSTNDLQVYMDKSAIVYLDENLTVDFSETASTFKLKSPSQMLNPRMSLLVK
ncbi:iron-sulfur cluster biosynthesis family protein [Metabacillus sp. RGM 3146]|uniref:iron-sulfur cluster biosynthesis family protein n=1 Tax=Metabacillus sp. RGM 3146 TaxID=3401092 RepID=UPI003B9B24C5